MLLEVVFLSRLHAEHPLGLRCLALPLLGDLVVQEGASMLPAFPAPALLLWWQSTELLPSSRSAGLVPTRRPCGGWSSPWALCAHAGPPRVGSWSPNGAHTLEINFPPRLPCAAPVSQGVCAVASWFQSGQS